MARPKKQFPPVREKFIGFRVTEDLYETLARDTASANLSISEYCRRLIAGKKINYQAPIIHNDSAIVDELRDINKLGNNMNQIARFLNQGGTITDGIADELREAIRLLTGSCIKINKAVVEEYGNH